MPGRKIDMGNELEMAEQQLTGYMYAKAGFSIEALAASMGLTAEEWEKIKARSIVLLDGRDTDALSAYYGKIQQR